MIKENSYSINSVNNGFIVNQTTETETTEGDTFSNSYNSETYVFTSWDDVLKFLKDNGETKAV